MVRSDAVAVADGVGGWETTEQADAALYSRLLMHNTAAELQRLESLGEKAEEFVKAEPVAVIARAFTGVVNVIGSCTTVLALLRGNRLQVATLGDAGLIMVRKGATVLRTKEQQHSFNFPFQLGTGSQSTPQDAAKQTIQVQEGDVLVTATDGLFDNLFDAQILEIVESALHKKTLAQFEPLEVSNRLVKAASEVATDTRSCSPFETKALEQGLFFQGGKMDDISVVVSIVEKTI